MTFGSDNFVRGSDRAFAHPGTGLPYRFSCAACSHPSKFLGSGIRLVMGVRQKVCAGCKTTIDLRKKATL